MKTSGDIMYLMFKYFTGPTANSENFRWRMYMPMTIRYCDCFGQVYNTLTFDCEKNIAILTVKNGPDVTFPIDGIAKSIKELGLLNDWKPTYLRYSDEELAMFQKDVEPHYKNIDVWKLDI